MTTISIAMATYNGARFVREQLESFSAQTRLPDELIVTDDASTDVTCDIVEEYRSVAPFPVRLYRNETNLGFVRNFERALSLCNGDLVFLSDQDDVWLPHKIYRMAEFLEDNPGFVSVSCDQINTNADLSHNGVTKFANMATLGDIPLSALAGCASAVRRSFLRHALPIPERISHDMWINSLAAHCAARYAITEPLQYWRRHDQAISRSRNSGVNGPLAPDEARPMRRPRPRLDRWTREALLTRSYIERLKAIAESTPALAAAARASRWSLRARFVALTLRVSLLGRSELARRT